MTALISRIRFIFGRVVAFSFFSILRGRGVAFLFCVLMYRPVLVVYQYIVHLSFYQYGMKFDKLNNRSAIDSGSRP